MRPYELYVGLRYTRAKRRTHFISFISFISMAGIALGIWALITVMSVMNGFEKEVRARILAAASHIQVLGSEAGIPDWERLAAVAKQHPQVKAVAPFVNAQGLLSTGTAVRGVFVRGILPEQENQVAEFASHMRSGDLSALRPGEFGIVIGVGIARALQLSVGDRVTLISPQGQVTPAGLMPRLKQFTVVGVFSMDHSEYDSALALARMEDAQVLYRMEGTVSGLRLKVADIERAPLTGREIAATMPRDTFVTDWTQQNVNYFRAVQIEKRMMFIILTLIIAVAAFNLVSTLVMAVTEKQPDIAILRTLGASPGSIMQIFVVQGTIIGLVGTLIGVAGGIVTALNIEAIIGGIERAFNFQVLSREVYYISEMPSDLHVGDVVWVALVSFGLSLLATLYPSWRASRVNPAEALRYE